MKEEIETTIKLLKQQKTNLINKLNSDDNNNINNCMNLIYDIDNKLKEYYNNLENFKDKIVNKKVISGDPNNNDKKTLKQIYLQKNKSKDNKNTKKHSANNLNFIRNENKENAESDNISNDEDSDLSNQNNNNNNKNKNKIKNTEYKLNSNQIEDIIINKGKTNIKIYFSENNFETNYTYKNKTTNKYYFHCDKRPKCPGKANFDVVKNKFYITEQCNNKISHNILDYFQLKELIENNQINLIDFTEKKNQKILIEYLFRAMKEADNIDIKKEFIKYTKSKLFVTNKEISYIKSKVYGKLRGLTLEECVKKINDESYELEVSTFDIKYKIQIKNENNEIERQEKIHYVLFKR